MDPQLLKLVADARAHGRGAVRPQGEPAAICARDIMTIDVACVRPDATVHEIALLLKEKHISAVPVIDQGAVVGIVSEGDLLHRPELGTAGEELSQSTAVMGNDPASMNPDAAKAHGLCARDVMTRNVVAVSESTSLPEIVRTLDGHHIRRVLVMRAVKLVGILSRANIVRTLAARPAGSKAPRSSDDDIIRFKVIETLLSVPGTSPWLTTVTVSNGIVELDGTIEDEAARAPSLLAVERLPYVVRVEDHRTILQPY